MDVQTFETKYLSGANLYGNDFSGQELEAWYDKEKEAYADLNSQPTYVYHSFNRLNGYRYLPSRQFKNVLGFGSATGEELLPLAHNIARVTIIDPSIKLRNQTKLRSWDCTYVPPSISGEIDLADGSVDLVTCFGVLHHIANVQFVLTELARVTETGGYLLVREPIVSMGDWRHARRGLTSNERGIPLKLFDAFIAELPLEVVKRSYVAFGGLSGMWKKVVGTDVYNSNIGSTIDRSLCSAFSWNHTYHSKSRLAKLQPTNIFYVLRKT